MSSYHKSGSALSAGETDRGERNGQSTGKDATTFPCWRESLWLRVGGIEAPGKCRDRSLIELGLDPKHRGH